MYMCCTNLHTEHFLSVKLKTLTLQSEQIAVGRLSKAQKTFRSSGERMKKLAPTATTSFSLLSFLVKECCVYRLLTFKDIKVSTLNFNYVPEKLSFHIFSFFLLKLTVFNCCDILFMRIEALLITIRTFRFC